MTDETQVDPELVDALAPPEATPQPAVQVRRRPALRTSAVRDAAIAVAVIIVGLGLFAAAAASGFYVSKLKTENYFYTNRLARCYVVPAPDDVGGTPVGISSREKSGADNKPDPEPDDKK